MESRDVIIQLAKAMAADGEAPPVDVTERVLASLPEAEIALVDLLIAEGGRAKPKAKLMAALGDLLYVAVETLRRRIDARHAEAIATFAQMRNRIRTRTEAGEVGLFTFMTFGQAFARAKLDPGEDFRELLEGLNQNAPAPARTSKRKRPADDEEEFTSESLLKTLVAMADGLNNDPFAIFDQIDQMIAAFPQDAKAMFLGVVATSPHPAVGEAVIGFLLDRNDAVFRAVAAGISGSLAGHGVSRASAQRLVLMRNWLPPARLPEYDALLRAVRSKAGSENPGATASMMPEVQTLLLSGCDGAGAHTIIAVCKEGRKFAFVSLLVKHGFGVRDALVLRGKGKAEINSILAHMGEQIGACPSLPATVSVLIGHGLADNIACGEPPPFGMIAVLEMAGLGLQAPNHIGTQALIDSMLAGLPSGRTDAGSVKSALRRSTGWPKQRVLVEGWFDDDDALVALLKDKPKARHAEVILTQFLPQPHQRQRWAQIFAWTALSLKHAATDTDYVDHVLIAREIIGTADLAGIPIFKYIAKSTAGAFAQR